jgi:hypothetical protein
MDLQNPQTKAWSISLRNYWKTTKRHGTKSWSMPYGQTRLTTKESIGTSPYQLVYGMDVVFPSSLGVPCDEDHPGSCR